MSLYIKSIAVNKIFHLNNFSIQMTEDSPHLILTGKNGSGKTILLNAIADFLSNIKNDPFLNFINYDRQISELRTSYLNATNDFDKYQNELKIKDLIDNKNRVYGKVNLDIPSLVEISKQYQHGMFVLAYYGAMRESKMQEPKNPTRPHISYTPAISKSSTDQFLNFLSDLKIQEVLARNEGQLTDANQIRDWFISFENLLCELFEDPNLNLDFNYRDYTFHIKTGGKSFKFTELSDGFTAAIDIIADLILKMQQSDNVTMAYNKPGIVLVDEIETHLHLSLQKNILKILTRVFPKVQFIVSTHSPFVLSSIDNATAFDLESQETITDLSEYSYESLAEGYFGVHTESSYLGNKLEQLKKLLSKEILTDSEVKLKQELIDEFNRIPEIISPLYVGEFRQLMIKEKAKQQ